MKALTHILAGLVLLLAALIKAAFPSSALDLVEWPLMGLEAALGILLLCGAGGRWMWRCTVAGFAMFSVAALWHVIRGSESCGCFGSVRVPPAMMLTMDFVMFVLLGFAGPREAAVKRAHSINAFLGAVLLVAFAGFVRFHQQTATAQLPMSAPSTQPAATQPDLAASVELTLGQGDEVLAALGQTAGGSLGRIELRVHNPFSEDVTIRVDEIECPCTKALVAPRTITGKDTAVFAFEFHAPEINGHYSKWVRFRTNAPAGTSLKLIISAQLTKP